MNWNLRREKTEDGVEVEGELTVFGQTYTREENPVIHRIGGLIATASFGTILLVSTVLFCVVLSAFAPIIITIIEVALSLAVLFFMIGIVKYIVTGNGKPFFELEITDRGFKISFLEW